MKRITLLTLTLAVLLQPSCSSMDPETKKILTDAGTRVLVAGAAAAEAAAIDRINQLAPRRATTGKQPIPTR